MTLRYHTPLSPTEQTTLGIATPQTLALADRVRYAELDILQHVNNKSYMGWFETLRVAHFHRFCAHHFQDGGSPRMVLRNANMQFIREMVMGEDYVATARVAAFRNTSYTLEQQLWAGDLRATLTAVMVLLAPTGSGRLPLPQSLRQQFQLSEGATSDA
ncbi:acyl-CoA thioesterase [Sedimentitalea todarodis]|uniref:Acyl-CoA thioesterase n=1 Tax=Sedimentitalea todarodis TaxID=1631240 RepID=A0ABU3VDP1_9RHOB|nr:acyl-CoA thioesterase [Sedimentitalea todarodis]MDU9003854.1 acyl-CoA thioesterase [Sedimentitalea todarodis]